MPIDRKKNNEKIICEFQEQWELRDSFTSKVAEFLEGVLKENDFRYHSVEKRTKKIDSLIIKLDNNPHGFKRLNDIHDLSGCRVLFILESDIERFINYIYGNFQVTKYNRRYSDDDYNADHLIVKLADDLVGQPDLSHFKDLKCEIQLTTLLYGAWSALAHDTIYKHRRQLSEFDKFNFDILNNHFKKVMREHIKEATYAFEFIDKLASDMEEGRKIFDLKFLQKISESNSINDIYDELELLSHYVERFGDKTPEELDIMALIINSINRSKELPIMERKTILGTLEGQTVEDIILVCLKIMDILKYYHIEKTFELLIELCENKDEKIREKATEVLQRQCRYDINAIKRIGFTPQLYILGEIEKWDLSFLLSHRAALETIGLSLLDPMCEGYGFKDYKTIEIQNGHLPANDEIKAIRRRIIVIIMTTYKNTPDVSHKKRLLEILGEAGRTPYGAKIEPDMLEMIVENVNYIVEFYVENADKAPFDLIKEMEEQMHRFIRSYGDAMLPKIRELEMEIEENKEYEFYKVFVGYDHEFPAENYEMAENIRGEKIESYFKDFNSKTYKHWEKRILNLLEMLNRHSYDKYINLWKFLEQLGQKKPAIAIKLIRKNEEQLSEGLVYLLRGSLASKRSEEAKSLAVNWINSNKYLSICAWALLGKSPFEIDLAKAIFAKAKQNSNKDALIQLARSVAFAEDRSRSLDNLLLNIIEEFSNMNENRWPSLVFIKYGSWISGFTNRQLERLLTRIADLPILDFDSIGILTVTARKAPKIVLQTLKIRIERSCGQDKDMDKIEAVPRNIYNLGESLRKYNDTISNILEWSKSKNPDIAYKARRFLCNIITPAEPPLKNHLLAMIKTKNKADAEVVLGILEAYRGSEQDIEICREFVCCFGNKKEYKTRLYGILSRTGVVEGEFGFSDAYEKKKEDIKYWLKDKNSKAKQFAKEYISYLENEIAFYKKRAHQSIELRKREFET